MSRSSAQRLRARLVDTPFDYGWDRALALHASQLSDPFAADPTPGAQPPSRTAAACPPRA